MLAEKTPSAVQLVAETRFISLNIPVPTIRVAPSTTAEGL